MRKPIGIIDSGVGGLTVANEIMRQLPRESFIYLGDSLRCPYGSRSKREVIEYTHEMVRFVLAKNIKMLVVACNTATAYTLNLLQKNLDIPVIGVIQPGARTAIKTTKNNEIGVIGTEATIESGSYQKAIKLIHPEVSTFGIACPLLVPFIEAGVLKGREILNAIKISLSPFKQMKCDTLILGCTHYPLIQDLIQKELGENVKVIASGGETAREVSMLLEFYDINNETNEKPQYNFFTTGNPQKFIGIANEVFNVQIGNLGTINIDVVKI